MDLFKNQSPIPLVYHLNPFRMDLWSSQASVTATSTQLPRSQIYLSSNTSNMASGYVQNGLMNKQASNSDNPVIRSGFGPRQVKHKLTPNNPTLDAMFIPEGWSNASPFLQSVSSCLDPEEYGLPPMKAIICDDMDTRYLFFYFFILNPV